MIARVGNRSEDSGTARGCPSRSFMMGEHDGARPLLRFGVRRGSEQLFKVGWI